MRGPLPPFWRDLVWLPIVLAVLLVVYVPSFGNPLLFDDAYLAEGLFRDYASFAYLRPRSISYGSFVWLQALVGEGWWKQRILNVAIHVIVVIALWALYREILRCISPASREEAGAAAGGYERSPALGFAIGFFALNPVAVYAVAYLIERSILLATMFVVLSLWLVARALATRKRWLLAPALVCYVLAVMSKEHAIMAPLAALVLYILIARPRGRRLAILSAVGALLVAAAGFVLWRTYGEIIGKPFDEYSQVYLAQLRALDPNVERNAFGLSIINQCYLFFQYGLRWVIPYTGLMSINLRPPFPVTWLTFPQILGVAGYVATVCGGFFLLVRFRDWRALVGVSVLMPALLFMTEFATVWVQDPFVLYRSYLWAIGIPGLVFVLVHGTPPRVLLAIGLGMAGLLAWQAVDRVLSLASPIVAWSDAIEKLTRDPRSVGRWFPYVNRGVAYVDRDEYESALRDFQASAALGDVGLGEFNAGAVLVATGHPRDALKAFERAEKQGYKLFNLPLQRGMAFMAIGSPAEAYRDFQAARALNPPSPSREVVLQQLARAALQTGKYDEAVAIAAQLLATEPHNAEARYLQAMSYVAKGDHARARELLDAWLTEGASGPALYARAMANYGLKRKPEAMADIDGALRMGLDNPAVRQWQARIRAMP